MGMTRNQLALVRYVAETIYKSKDAALCCCTEDTTQKIIMQSQISKFVTIWWNESYGATSKCFQFATMEDLTNTYLESRYYLTNEERNYSN